MSRQSVLARAKAAALAGMVDSCTVKHPTGQFTSPETGAVTPTWSTTYSGVCKVQQRQNAIARPAKVGEAEVFIARLELHLPTTVTGVASDDLVTITASQLADLVGRTFRIRELGHKTWTSALRFQMVEVTS